VSGLDDPDLVLRYWKPHGVLTAFTDREGRATLADDIDVPDVYPAGRLDRDSEGLLLLPRSPAVRRGLTEGHHPRTYLVLVERCPDAEALRALATGVELKDGRSRPATAELLATPPDLPPRDVPVRVRTTVTDHWLRLTLTEGRNRQVRRMTAAVGHPTLRLVRESIGPITLAGLAPRQWEVLDRQQRQALRDLTARAVGSSSPPAHDRRRRGRRSRG
jgi:23S rRNA pseudouridine2457 synthase